MLTIMCTCPFCGVDHHVICSDEGYARWQGGELIQNALPELTPDEREALITSICPKCQKGIFGEPELEIESDPEELTFDYICPHCGVVNDLASDEAVSEVDDCGNLAVQHRGVCGCCGVVVTWTEYFIPVGHTPLK